LNNTLRELLVPWSRASK